MSRSESTTPEGRRSLYIIDGHAQIFRAYHAIRSGLTSPVTGEPTNATFGFVGMLLKLLREHDPDYLAIVIDVAGDTETFRSQLDPEYKATRDAPPEDLHPQVRRIVEIAQIMGIPVLGVAGVEADDVIASLCERFHDQQDLHIRLVSKDKDLQQLLNDHVEMFDVHTDQAIGADRLKDDKGITPDQVVDMLALMGDNVDNIPGVPGIGPKTAAKLIGKYGSIDHLLAHIDELPPKQREKIDAARERLALNRELVQLKRDVPVAFDLSDAEAAPPDVEALAPVFKQLGFARHLQELESLTGRRAPAQGEAASAEAAPSDSLFADAADSPPTLASHLDHADPADFLAVTSRAQLDALLDHLRALGDHPLSVDTETTSVTPMRAELCGISLAWPPQERGSSSGACGIATVRGVYIPVRSPDPAAHLDAATVLAALRPVLEDASIRKVGQNIKYDMIVLRRAGIELRGVAFDTMIASFLLDAARSSHKLDNLALAFCEYEMIPLTQLIGVGRSQIRFDEVPLEQATTYAAEDADIVLRLMGKFEPQLRMMGLRKLLDELEMPLAPVLAELEYNGIEVDAAELDRQREQMSERIDALRGEIIDTAGVDFSPDSPRQLADVLFNQLGCKSYKKLKTGPSTDSEVLQRVADEQSGPGAKVAEMILEYRQLTKLVGTYLVALKEAIHPETGRVHASFNQTGAATGRLSSSDPNLQNIPIRTDIGRRIRKAFVAPDGHVLLSADYSQIELRLLAHLSQDRRLIEAFEQDMDIHRAVAAEVFGVGLDEVTGDQRVAAKMVNFGIVYGITPYGLARRLTPGASGDDVERARRIIDDYKARYPKIDQFLARCVGQAEAKGYVETIMKRRRPIPQINSNRGNVQQLGRRMAINSVVQGSAADLIKQAMVNLHAEIVRQGLPMKMLLQIHDELVVEAPEAEVAAMAKVMRDQMQGAMSLSVPLKVELSHGRNWMEAK